MTEASSPLLAARDGAVARLRFNRPAALNALTAAREVFAEAAGKTKKG